MRPFERELEKITVAVLRLSALVEGQTCDAIRSLCDPRPDLAKEVIRGDTVIDRLEVRIEEDCLLFLARHDPLARDLRRVATVLKINHELERIGDEAANIARQALSISRLSRVMPIPLDLEAMSDQVMAMVRGSFDAFIGSDPQLACEIIDRDEDVDRLHRRIIDGLKGAIREHPDVLDMGLCLYAATAHLERIADHATNIAEEVVYLARGSIIRHRHGDAAPVQRNGRSARRRAQARLAIPAEVSPQSA